MTRIWMNGFVTNNNKLFNFLLFLMNVRGIDNELNDKVNAKFKVTKLVKLKIMYPKDNALNKDFSCLFDFILIKFELVEIATDAPINITTANGKGK